eukprot:531748_1
MSKAPVSREERSKSAYKRKLSLSQIRHSEVDIGNVSVLRIREFLGPVLLLIPVLYNQFTVPFRIAFYYRAVTRESLAFFALDVVMDLWVWADILVRVRALVADYQKIKETASSVPISLRQKMATAFDILCAFPVDYIMRLASVRYISPYRLGRMFSMFSVSGRFTKLERIYEEFKGSSNTALWRMAHYTFYYIMASHLTGCVFFYIAQDEYFSGSTSWYYAQVGEAELSSIWTQYINSIYWAIVTMTTVGFGDRIPITTLETVFVVFVEVLGLALTCTIVANLSTLVANMDSAVGDFQR